jgi:nidogen (entactin)
MITCLNIIIPFRWTNAHEPGKYIFRVGNISYDNNIAVPDQYNQNEVEVEEESKTCAQSALSVCHIQARCVDYQAGICCKCNDGFYGNGRSCIKNDVPLRVHGKVNGILNNINLNDIDIQAYVVVDDGRSYTALSLAPSNLGNSLQLLNVLGGVIGWLFAKPSGNANNGYQLTGALFNHTADIYFPATKDRVIINQEFLGHDVFDQITLDSDIRGTVPFLPVGTKIEVLEFDEHFTIVEPGVIRSESTRTFKNKMTGENINQIVTQTFTYNPTCRHAPPSEEDTAPQTLRVFKNYLGFELKDNIVRYGSSNRISFLGQEDPCKEGRNSCAPHSTCVADGSSFTCVCHTGFTDIYKENTQICIDVDECQAGIHNCDNNADCYNHEGSFQCRCRNGFEGNGVSCRRIQHCTRETCGSNARCVEQEDREPTCECDPGYTNQGQNCVRAQEHTCNYCDRYANCLLSEVTNVYYCQCLPGFTGNGFNCVEVQSYSTEPTDTAEDLVSVTVPDVDLEVTTVESEYNDTIVLPHCEASGCYCPTGYSNYRDERNNDLCRLNVYPSSEPSFENNDTSSKI